MATVMVTAIVRGGAESLKGPRYPPLTPSLGMV